MKRLRCGEAMMQVKRSGKAVGLIEEEERIRQICNPKTSWTKQKYICSCGYRGKLRTQTPGYYTRNGTDEFCPRCRKIRLFHLDSFKLVALQSGDN